MSYSIYLSSKPCPTCNRCGDEPDRLNPTYNLTPIFAIAFTGEPLSIQTSTDRPRGLRLLNGRYARYTIALLQNALGRLSDPAKEAEFKKLEPDNGWGTLKDARWVIEKLISNAEEYPDNVWEVR